MASWNSRQAAIAVGLVGLVAGIGSTATLSSCTSLLDVPENVCGNGVVEDGEDCDGFPDYADAGADADADADEDAGSRKVCGAPSTPGACRYICTYHGDYPACPAEDGAQCGVDGICRIPRGLSDTPLSVYGSGAERLFSDDFDGDGRADAVAIGTSAIDIHFFATSGSIDKTITTPVDTPRLPGIGDVNGDSRADLVLNLGKVGLGVLLAQEDRTLVTRSYPTRVIPQNVDRLVALGPAPKGGILLSFSRDPGMPNSPLQLSLLFPMRPSGSAISTVTIAAPNEGATFTGELVGSVAVSHRPLDQDIPCRSVAFFLAKPSDVELNVIRCGNAEDAQAWAKTQLDRTTFPGSWTSRGGAFFADLDNDNDEDLAYDASPNKNESAVYARMNDGTKLQSATLFAAFSASACTSGAPNTLRGRPLAIGDLNGDHLPDIVDSAGIWFQKAPIPRKCIGSGDGTWGETGEWKAAAIGDFDGNGISDVLAVRSEEPVIDFWGGVGNGAFNTVTISPGFDIQDLVVGDFDGDSISDAILRPYSAADTIGMGGGMGPSPDGGIDAGSQQGPPEIFVIFGKPFSAPNQPIRLGQLDGIPTAIVAGDITGTNAAGDPDPLTDLAVVTQTRGPQTPEMMGNEQLSIIAGDSHRMLLAPLMLTHSVDLNSGSSSLAEPGQILISRFQSDHCKPYMVGNDPNSSTSSLSPQTIAVLERGGAATWLAGCKENSTALQMSTDPPSDKDSSWELLFPVQRDESIDSLGIFTIESAGADAKIAWLEANPPDGGVSLVRDNAGGKGTPILLPAPTEVDPFKVPYRFVDINGSEDALNSKREIAFVSNDGTQIVVYWNRSNGPGDSIQTTITQDDVTLIPLNSSAIEHNMGGPPQNQSERDIRDFVFMNIDRDPEKELVVLTRNGIYTVQATKAANQIDPTFDSTNIERLYTTFSGRALLAIDANSDGIEDLLLADDRKLLLFLGQETGR